MNISYERQNVQPFDLVISAIPELFGVTQSNIDIRYNLVLWYISAMLITMLLLVYMLVKNKDFFLYVFSPLASLLGLGFMYRQDIITINIQLEWYGFIEGGNIVALSGLCFGVVTYLIYEKFCSIEEKRFNKILFTAAEALISFVFFWTWLINPFSKDTVFSALLLLPILIAIIFSGKSYISDFFKFKCFKYAGPLSFKIYISHIVAVIVANAFLKERSSIIRIIATIVLTTAVAALNFLAVKIIKLVWKKIKQK